MVSIITPLRQPHRAEHLRLEFPTNMSRCHRTEFRWQTGINPQNPADIINNLLLTHRLLRDNTMTLTSIVRHVKDLTPHLISPRVNTTTVQLMAKPRSTRIMEAV